MTETYTFNPKLDLRLERIVDVKPELVWKAWTQPEHVKKWFTPAPWETVDCKIDLRPGGIFQTTMQSPEGDKFPNKGIYLEIIANKKLVWTSAMEAGFRPVAKPENPAAGLLFTAMIVLEPHPKGCKYTAYVMHSGEADRDNHDAMGFQEGWGKALDQLVAHAKTMG